MAAHLTVEQIVTDLKAFHEHGAKVIPMIACGGRVSDGRRRARCSGDQPFPPRKHLHIRIAGDDRAE
jgi:hypothetical protein